MNLERPGEPDDEECGVYAKKVWSQQRFQQKGDMIRFQCKKKKSKHNEEDRLEEGMVESREIR